MTSFFGAAGLPASAQAGVSLKQTFGVVGVLVGESLGEVGQLLGDGQLIFVIFDMNFESSIGESAVVPVGVAGGPLDGILVGDPAGLALWIGDSAGAALGILVGLAPGSMLGPSVGEPLG